MQPRSVLRSRKTDFDGFLLEDEEISDAESAAGDSPHRSYYSDFNSSVSFIE